MLLVLALSALGAHCTGMDEGMRCNELGDLQWSVFYYGGWILALSTPLWAAWMLAIGIGLLVLWRRGALN